MALSISPAARAFDRSSRTADDLKTFWKDDAKGAATWLAEIARASNNAPVELQEAAKAFANHAKPDELVKLVRTAVKNNPALFDTVASATAQATAQAQQAGTQTMGWTTAAPAAGAAAGADRPEPANFTGMLQRTDDGTIQFKTQTGTFDVDLTGTDWREEIETTFLRNAHGRPQLLTLKAFPSADGKRLYVEQFAPGADPNFIAGRVRVENGKVFLSQSWNTDKVQVTHPEFVKLLLANQAEGLVDFSPAGVILPGKVTRDENGQKVFAEMPEGFFLLGRTMKLNVGEDAKHEYHELDTGYFRATSARASPDLKIPARSKPGGAEWDAGDTTKGSTNDTTGPRAFFFAKILPHDERPPADAKFDRPPVRRIEISAVSDQGDYGKHSPNNSTSSRDFGMMAKTVPASVQRHTKKQGTIDPSDD